MRREMELRTVGLSEREGVGETVFFGGRLPSTIPHPTKRPDSKQVCMPIIEFISLLIIRGSSRNLALQVSAQDTSVVKEFNSILWFGGTSND